MTKRPNPAVEASERRARNAEELADIAEREVKGPLQGRSTAQALRGLAERRRTGANKIKRDRPYLISNE